MAGAATERELHRAGPALRRLTVHHRGKTRHPRLRLCSAPLQGMYWASRRRGGSQKSDQTSRGLVSVWSNAEEPARGRRRGRALWREEMARGKPRSEGSRWVIPEHAHHSAQLEPHLGKRWQGEETKSAGRLMGVHTVGNLCLLSFVETDVNKALLS